MKRLDSHIISIALMMILVAGFIVCPELAQSDVLYDNGPLVNRPGEGAGGADASAVQTNLGMDLFGSNHSPIYPFRVADDFTVTDPLGWQIDQIRFFAYQTGSTTTSTITAVNLRIWDGSPDNPSSNIVFGDTTTNRLVNTEWSGIYRVLDTDLLNVQRPIMTDTVDVGTSLIQGTYWLDWQTDGTLAYGPWAPPITINGQTTTGNALQFDGYYAAAWVNVVDIGNQGFPFIIEGRPVAPIPEPATMLLLGSGLLGLAAYGRKRFRK